MVFKLQCGAASREAWQEDRSSSGESNGNQSIDALTDRQPSRGFSGADSAGTPPSRGRCNRLARWMHVHYFADSEPGVRRAASWTAPPWAAILSESDCVVVLLTFLLPRPRRAAVDPRTDRRPNLLIPALLFEGGVGLLACLIGAG